MDEKWEKQDTYTMNAQQDAGQEKASGFKGSPDGIEKETDRREGTASAGQEESSTEASHSSPYHMTGKSLTEPRWEAGSHSQSSSFQNAQNSQESAGSSFCQGGYSAGAGSSYNAETGAGNSYNAGSGAGSGYSAGEGSSYNAGSGAGSGYSAGTGSSYSAEVKGRESRKTRKAQSRKEKKPASFGRKMAACVALAVVFGLVAGLVFQGVNLVSGKYLGAQEPQAQVQLNQTGGGREDAEPVSASGGYYNSVAEVVQDTKPAAVAITCVGVQEVRSWLGGNYQQQISSAGSGIIVGKSDSELLIATNEHVVEDATEISVTFIDNETVPGVIKGTDENDLAVVAVSLSDIKQETLEQIKVATIGDSDQLREGEQVVAIGNALGQGTAVAAGYVSALNQKIQVDNIEHVVIQLDIAINHGNSGGALFNMKGELVGINEAKGVVQSTGESADGMGYAIPINQAEPILTNLMNRKTRTEVTEDQVGFLGVSGINVNSDAASMYNLPIGVYVNTVTEGSPAEKAGIQKGDIIKSFDGQKVSDFASLQSLLTYYRAGETVEVVIVRADDGEYQESILEVTLAARNDYAD